MIVFNKVRYKNFLSAGNRFIEIQLDKTNTTLIIGDNGAGKSAGIIDAVYFALYGKPYRKLKQAQVVNSINQKNCLVELDFTIDKKKYKVRRGIKPNIFDIFIDGVLKENSAGLKDYQDYLENSILKMNSTTMKQIVFLGSTTFVPFMRLCTNDRRKVIEEILDIQVFSLMNQILKTRGATLATKYSELQNQIKMVRTKIELKEQHRDELAAAKGEQVAENERQIAQYRADIEAIEKESEIIHAAIDEALEEVTDETKVNKTSSELSLLISTIKKNQNKNEREIVFFKENDECPTCSQPIHKEFKAESIDSCQKKVDECSKAIDMAESRLSSLSARLGHISEVQKYISENERKVASNNTRIRTISEHVKALETANKKIQDENTNESASDVDKEIQGLGDDLSKMIKDKGGLADTGQYYSLISSLLKDSGIKSQIIRNYLPTINSLIRKYLEILEFPCEFTFDESFNETLKSRHRDQFSYANFSEGQKMRIDLALLFTWRELARLRNSASCNLLVLDEIGSSSLDAAGTEAFMRIIEETTDNSNIFVITHDNTITDQFARCLEYKLVDDFSVMMES